ncbi:MAG: hypothetical protein BMS9Abin11_1581 [Gammaproteobacteria bacterium]|nr:MAG: hypothetical protein BMS9Abin11_1581 [Gammaproteobacteria bacterium]
MCDLDLAEGLSGFMGMALNEFIHRGVEPSEFMGVNSYMSLLALVYTVDARLRGKDLNEAIIEADEKVEKAIAIAESTVIDNNPNMLKM